MKYKLVLFDLDGTLLDTSEGIFYSVRYAEKMMELNPVDDTVLRNFVGPPPKQMYMETYGIDEAVATEATRFHREYGRTRAIYENSLYPGLTELLSLLRNSGVKTGVATLKSQNIAEHVLRIADIFEMFDVVVGMNEDESLSKADTIRICQEITGIKDHTVLVGDSSYDMEGARAATIDFIGVTYGFGFEDDDKIDYGFLVSSVYELSNVLLEV